MPVAAVLVRWLSSRTLVVVKSALLQETGDVVAHVAGRTGSLLLEHLDDMGRSLFVGILQNPHGQVVNSQTVDWVITENHHTAFVSYLDDGSWCCPRLGASHLVALLRFVSKYLVGYVHGIWILTHCNA